MQSRRVLVFAKVIFYFGEKDLIVMPLLAPE